jgi:hypothetical protein
MKKFLHQSVTMDSIVKAIHGINPFTSHSPNAIPQFFQDTFVKQIKLYV